MKGLFYVLVILRIIYLHFAILHKEERYTRIITLKQGNVTGRILKPKKNNFLSEVEVYLGIPYAAPPIGNLRFMPPGAPLQWSDTLNAFYVKPVCPQMLPNVDSITKKKMPSERNAFIKRMKYYLKNENEDCLYLNIYVPHTPNRGNFPVILFVHGESFEWNSGNLYDGSVIASYGKVIFITINFRLGIFGFLKQGLMVGRANFGLSDQIAALKWTKGNIAEFGGDPSKITVMGHDTGAACVNFLMLSPVAEGLFHRAILMSGSALSEWALTATPLHYIQLKDEFNCSSDNIINCLQRKRKEDIMSAFKKYELQPFENFTPVVDEIVVLNSPAEHMEKYSLFSKYDLLTGVNEVESYYLLEEEFLKLGMLMNEGHNFLDKYTKAVFKKTPDIALIKTIEKYLGHLRDNTPTSVRNAVFDALSDMLVTAPLLQTVRYHASTPRSTYLYVFGHRTISENTIKINRSVYGDDLPYALGVPLDGPSYHYQSNYSVQEEQLSEMMLRYFTNFAKTGNPNIPQSHEFLTFSPYLDFKPYTIRWPFYNVDKQPYLYFSIPPQIRHHYREEYDRFWNQALITSMKDYDGNSMENDDRNKNSDNVENDETQIPPTYDLPFPIPLNPNYNQYNNFYKLPASSPWPPSWQSNYAISGETSEPSLQTSSFTAVALIIIGTLFLLINIVAFGFIFYQRGKLRVRENLFRNRFRCKTVSVPDIFEENEQGDIYAVAENRRKEYEKMKLEEKKSKYRRSKKINKGLRKIVPKIEGDVNSIRVASIKPEAINGKRLRRWPLSRQCSGSTITIDAHSKVRNWITHEIVNKCSPAFLRKNKKTKLNNGVDDSVDFVNKSDNLKHSIEQLESAVVERKLYDKNASITRKVSIAVDATPAARTESVLKQIPIEVTKSLDDGKSPLLSKQMRSAASTSCIRKKNSLHRSNVFTSEDSDEYFQRTGTHKSSAHIRLKTPDFFLETMPPVISHSHSRSDPSPMIVRDSLTDPLYSSVNKDKKRLKSFAGDSLKTIDSTDLVPHYEEINVTSLPDFPEGIELCEIANTEQTLCNIVRRNFPKVLPDFPEADRKNCNRLSLPPSSGFNISENLSSSSSPYLDCYSKNISRSGRIAPVPPPRLTSTLGRRPLSPNSDKQCSHITVQLRKAAPVINEEKLVDIIQTENCDNVPDNLNIDPSLVSTTVQKYKETICVPSGSSAEQECDAFKLTKNVRSVTTSTSGIP